MHASDPVDLRGRRRCYSSRSGVWRPHWHRDVQYQLDEPYHLDSFNGFIRAADGALNWEGEVWDKTIKVPCTTLDALIAEHGLPAFTKIDVEGFESAVLAGLSRPLVALSFEFTTIQRNVAMKCLDRLTSLAPYRFDVALGNSYTFIFNQWISKAEMAAYIEGLPHAANAGDVYCVLQE
jgi:Methyltransferase FkbM domain